MHGSVKSYTIGFILSLVLTFQAYVIVTSRSFSVTAMTLIVLLLAIVQLLVQLFFFLHFDRAGKRSWNILLFLFMGVVVTIVTFGSLWIMQHLNYHMSSPVETTEYLQRNEDL